MNDLYADGLHKYLHAPHQALHSYCKYHRAPYAIRLDQPTEQHYEVPLTFADKLRQHLHDVCDERYVSCDLEKDEQYGVGVIKLVLIPEGQYKYSSDFHIRQQSSYPSTFNPARSHGGVTKRAYQSKKATKEEIDHSFVQILEDILKDH